MVDLVSVLMPLSGLDIVFPYSQLSEDFFRGEQDALP